MSAADPLPVENLAVRAGHGALAAFISQGGKFVLNFAVAVILARLLSPEDFGLFALAFAITGFLEFAKDGGMVLPVVQAEELTLAQIDTLFWFNAGVGLLVTVIACGAALVVGSLYADARIVPLTCALALSFLVGGLSTQHLGLLRRQMRFTALALCEVVALTVAAVAAVAAAMHGAGYWALVLFQLLREALQAVFVVIATRWLPAWPTQWAPVQPLVRSGGIMMVFELLGYLVLKMDKLIVGWFVGPSGLGFYDKAFQLLLLPVNQINAPLSGVVHSTLSRLQREPERFRGYFMRALFVTTSLGLPVIAFAAVNADAVIAVLFGTRWLPAAPIFRALAPAAALMTMPPVGWICFPLGRGRRQLPWTIFTTATTVAAIFIGVRWGPVGVALAYSVTRVVLFLPTLVFTCHGTPLAWPTLLAAAARPALASTIGAIASLAADAMLARSAAQLLFNGALFAAVYHLCWLAIPGGRMLVRDSLSAARALYRAERS